MLYIYLKLLTVFTKEKEENMLPPDSRTMYVDYEVESAVKDDFVLIAYLEERKEDIKKGKSTREGIINWFYNNGNVKESKRQLAYYGERTIPVIEALLHEEDHEINLGIIRNQQNITEEILDYFAVNGNEDERAAVAGNQKTRRGTLDKLSQDSSRIVRLWVATNSSAYGLTLHDLSKEDDVKIKAAVAENPATRGETLEKLSEDKSKIVRENVLSNNNITMKCFENLLFDKSTNIRKKAEEKVIPFLTDINTSVLAKKGLFQEIATLKIVGDYLQSKDATIRKKARSELIRIFNLAK